MAPDKTDEPERLRKSRLAAALGVSRVTLDAYLNRADPPPPLPDGKLEYSVEECARYISTLQREKKTPTGTDWKRERERVSCEMLVVQLEILKGKYISREEAGRTIHSLVGELVELMRAEFEQRLPQQYRGRDSMECCAMNCAAIDKIIARFRSGAAPLVAAA